MTIPLAPDPLCPRHDWIPLDHAAWEADSVLRKLTADVARSLLAFHAEQEAPIAEASGPRVVACAFQAAAVRLGRSDVDSVVRKMLRTDHPSGRALGRMLVERRAVVRVRGRFRVAPAHPTTLAIAASISPSN